ncbi:uncharacterized protein LOC128235777 [Mya arenaria]|uniref:uncharacterized protein LOC128235777 n=1 Tax=Mya arenaria TaxID=6604 RepID=UPI0022E23AF2|nr:uncharacterized protein LOC128235777 [Mya arenaria]
MSKTHTIVLTPMCYTARTLDNSCRTIEECTKKISDIKTDVKRRERRRRQLSSLTGVGPAPKLEDWDDKMINLIGDSAIGGFAGVDTFLIKKAVTLNLNYTPIPALENSPVTLTCSYTGLQTDETIIRVSWEVKALNEAVEIKGRILMPACTAIGVIDTSLYRFSCGLGYFTWTFLNVSRNSDQHMWRNTIATTLNGYETNTTLNVQVPITAVSMTAPTDSTVTINAGDSETFKCRTSGGLPQATIKWFKVTGDTCSQSGTELTSSVSSPSVSVVDGLKQVESTLIFTATRTQNGLGICCTASNVAGMQRVSRTKPLDVRSRPWYQIGVRAT